MSVVDRVALFDWPLILRARHSLLFGIHPDGAITVF